MFKEGHPKHVTLCYHTAMFRTRDFVLFFTAIIFLVSAIGITAIKQGGTEARQNTIFPKETKEITEVQAVVTNTVEVEDKESRIERLKRKIAERGVTTYSQPEEESSAAEETQEMILSETVEQTLQLCSDYSESVISGWNPGEIDVQEVEGLRQYFITDTTEVASTTASTTELLVQKTVRLSLPVTSIPTGSANCLPSNIIGVALDGSLIRNTEVSLYGIFSAETLLGYALDGFPIYGTSKAQTDQCGGRVVNGQYRYELLQERETLISCYSGTLQTIK